METEKKVTEITNLINALFDEPDISNIDKDDLAITIAGFVTYLACSNEDEFDEMLIIIRNEFLRLKGKWKQME